MPAIRFHELRCGPPLDLLRKRLRPNAHTAVDVYVPATTVDTPSPLVVFLPGKLDSVLLPHTIEHAASVLELGCTPMLVQPPGTGVRQSVTRYTMRETLVALAGAIHWALRTGAHPQVVLIGHSLGGLIALHYASMMLGEDISQIDAVIATMAPPTGVSQARGDLLAWKRAGVRRSSRLDPRTMRTRAYDLPFSFAEDASTLHLGIGSIITPTLLLAGDHDTVVSPLLVSTTASYVQKDLRTFFVLPEIDHDYRHDPDSVQIIDGYIRRFLRSILGR